MNSGKPSSKQQQSESSAIDASIPSQSSVIVSNSSSGHGGNRKPVGECTREKEGGLKKTMMHYFIHNLTP